MLGTAGDERLTALVGHLVDRSAGAALADLDAALGEGVDVAQLLEQLFGRFRDCMAAAVDCPAETFQYASPASQEEVAWAGKRLGLTTVLAVMQIIEQTLSRLRYSTQGRILAELALVRICALEDLDELSGLIAELQSGSAAVGGTGSHSERVSRSLAGSQAGGNQGQTPAPPSSLPETAVSGRPAIELTPDTAAEVWTRALSKVSGMVAEQAREFDHVALVGQSSLAIRFKSRYALAKSICERPEVVNRFEQALAEVTGQPVRVSFAVEDDQPSGSEPAAEQTGPVSLQQRLLEVANHPMVRRANELFGAQPTRIDDTPKQQ